MTTEMPASSVIEILALLGQESIDAWLDGGWGVDALLGRHTRQHKDLDIVLQVEDVSKARQILSRRGFTLKKGSPPDSFVLEDGSGLEIDIHAVVFDSRGNGSYRMQHGEIWIYPAEGFTGVGVVNNVPVSCLSPAAQIYCHGHGYTPTDKDFSDMELIRSQFGLELPPQLTRELSDPQ